MRAVAASPNLSSDPAARLLTIIRGLRRSADVEGDALSVTATSPCWAVNLLAVADPALFGISPHPLPFPGLVRRRLFRADRDPDRERDDISEFILDALYETLCDVARMPRAAAAFAEAFPALREHSRLRSVWMLLFAYGSITPAQLARALPCTKAGAAKLLRQLAGQSFAVTHGRYDPYVCSLRFSVDF